MEIVSAIVTGVFSSFVASLFFLLVLSKLRPEIAISEKIAATAIDGQIVYQIKIKNCSTKRSIVGIRAELHLISSRAAPRGRLSEAEEISLTRKDPIIIEPYNNKDHEAMYAARFKTYEDLARLWDDSTHYLRFVIYGSDSLSGLGKTFEQKYTLKRTDIIEGDFCVGDSSEIE